MALSHLLEEVSGVLCEASAGCTYVSGIYIWTQLAWPRLMLLLQRYTQEECQQAACLL